VKLPDLRGKFNDFFFSPISPVPIAAYRILYGACVSATLILLREDWLNWFGVHGWVTLSTMRAIEPGVRLNLFTVFPQDDRWINGFFWFSFLFAILTTLGLWTRVSTVVLFLCVTSIQQRNLFITNGGDAFLRVTGFFLMFAPAGAALSIDRLIRVRRGLEGNEPVARAPWAQRMIQIELALVYFISFLWKAKGHAWWDGTALYYVTHLPELRRFPISAWIQHPLILKLGGWFTLVFEFSMGTLIWIKPFRYPLLILGVLFHLSLEYATNIPMFQWDILAAYVLFLDDRVWQRFARVSRSRIGNRP
jgi:hypothetical protein